MGGTFFIFFLLLLSLIGAPALAQGKATASPRRVLFLVFDQMRPDYVDRFNLKHFKTIRQQSAHYKNALVGHSASITIVSHMVMTSGLYPKDLPWTDDFYQNFKGLLGSAQRTYTPSDFTEEQFLKVLETIPAEHSLVHALKEKNPGKVYFIGQKKYATITFAGTRADSISYLEKNSQGKCEFKGRGTPEYLQVAKFKVDCKNAHGTEDSFYPLEGNKYLPLEKSDEEGFGGDALIAQAGIEVMKKDPQWSALFLTMGSIDKFAHMLGQTDIANPISFQSPKTLEEIAQYADQQLGQLRQALTQLGIAEETLIVITADHGGQTNLTYLGSGKKEDNFWVQRLKETHATQKISQDTQLRVYLDKSATADQIKKLELRAKEISKAVGVYKKSEAGYQPIYENLAILSAKEKKWYVQKNLPLLNTSFSDQGPDYVVTFPDNVGFGLIGDHGGNQEAVQRIPYFIYNPLKKGQELNAPVHLKDLKKLILSQ